MADDLFTLQAVIVEERLIRHHVAVLAVDHHDHFMKSVDGMAISLQPGFSQLAAGDVFDDAYAHWGRVSVARASRNRDPYPNQLAVFTPIAHLQLELRQLAGPEVRDKGRAGRTVFFAGKVDVRCGPKLFLRVPHHIPISAIRRYKPAIHIRYRDAHGRVVEEGAPAVPCVFDTRLATRRGRSTRRCGGRWRRPEY